MATENVLEVRGLTTVFRSNGRTVRAVDQVSFDVPAGATIGLVGESGCGKSATAGSIVRMIPAYAGEIIAGSVALQGEDLMTMSPKQLRRVRGARIGFVPQDPLSSLNPLIPVGRQIGEVFRQHRGASRREARQRATELLARVGIPRPADRLGDYPHQFSGGMRQRVGIAMGIACDPVLLLADEPTTALDVTTQAQILDLLKRLAAENAMATVLITHDLGVAAHMCDSIKVMYAGQIVEDADVDDFFARPMSPYARGLMAALPSAPLGVDGRLRGIPGAPPAVGGAVRGCRFAPRCGDARDRCRTEEPQLGSRGARHQARCFGTEHQGWIT